MAPVLLASDCLCLLMTQCAALLFAVLILRCFHGADAMMSLWYWYCRLCCRCPSVPLARWGHDLFRPWSKLGLHSGAGILVQTIMEKMVWLWPLGMNSQSLGGSKPRAFYWTPLSSHGSHSTMFTWYWYCDLAIPLSICLDTSKASAHTILILWCVDIALKRY